MCAGITGSLSPLLPAPPLKRFGDPSEMFFEFYIVVGDFSAFLVIYLVLNK